MQLINTSQVISQVEGKIKIKAFNVEAGQRVFLTLTAPATVERSVSISLMRKAGESCGKAIAASHTHDGKPVRLGYANDAAFHTSDKYIVDWPGSYYLVADHSAIWENPDLPIVVELHREDKHENPA